MKLDRTAAIAEIVSSVAIVATLAYLAVQAHQTNNLLLGDSREAALQADMQLVTNVLNNADAASRILGRDVETIETDALLISFMRAREYQWLQYKNGTLDRETFESYMSPVKGWLSSEVGANWWETSGQQFDNEFRDYVSAVLEGRSL